MPMMRPRPTTLALCTALCAAVACTAWPASLSLGVRHASCPPRGVEVFKRFDEVVVYRREPPESYRASSVNVCVRATRRASRVSREGYYQAFAGRLALAARGTTVAWAGITNDDGADGDHEIIDIMATDFGAAQPVPIVSAPPSDRRTLCSLWPAPSARS